MVASMFWSLDYALLKVLPDCSIYIERMKGDLFTKKVFRIPIKGIGTGVGCSSGEEIWMYCGRWAAKIQTDASTALGMRTVEVCGGNVFLWFAFLL